MDYQSYRSPAARKKAALRRSVAAKKGWETRRRVAAERLLLEANTGAVPAVSLENSAVLAGHIGAMSDQFIETVNHPQHYGGDTTYEAIKVIEAWELGFCLGNAVKYICRAGKKSDVLEDLQKAAWYLNREIDRIRSCGSGV